MRMYVLVNKDMGNKKMTNSYHHVQATHAVAEYIHEAMSEPKSWQRRYKTVMRWANDTLIVLGVSKRQMNHYIMKLSDNLIPFSYFTEPDLNNELTAISCILDENDYKMFKHLKLLGKR